MMLVCKWINHWQSGALFYNILAVMSTGGHGVRPSPPPTKNTYHWLTCVLGLLYSVVGYYAFEAFISFRRNSSNLSLPSQADINISDAIATA